jgi:hypothetical protein
MHMENYAERILYGSLNFRSPSPHRLSRVHQTRNNILRTLYKTTSVQYVFPLSGVGAILIGPFLAFLKG